MTVTGTYGRDFGVGAASPPLRPGTAVEVKIRFDGSWASGFEVDTIENDGFRIRRVSDGNVIPLAFPAEDLHPAG